MSNEGDGKGPGYLYLWGATALLFIALITAAGIAGALPWWGAMIGDLAVAGVFAQRMLTADWD